jgi:regulator of sigma E protease
MDVVTQIFAFLMTVLVLVSIHEAGHMVVARALGIQVLRYSIGFGKVLWRHQSKKSGTEYAISLLPLGGYVKLLDEREMAVPEADKHRAFNRQSLLSRIAVVAAGPLTNIIFAIVVYWIMFSVGVEVVKPIVGQVTANSVAAQAGIHSGDTITKVGGKSVADWQDILLPLIGRMGESGELSIETISPQGQVEQHRIDVAQWKVDPLTPDPLQSLGIEPFRPPQPAIVEKVQPDSPAAKAGVKPGDQFIAVDGKAVKDWYALVKTIQPHPGKNFNFTLERDGKPLALAITPDSKFYLRGMQSIGVIGVNVKPTDFPQSMKFEKKYSPLKAFVPASAETLRFFNFNFVMIKKMFKGEISLRSLGGPITIFNSADRAFKAGLIVFLNFLALISVMLAFVNVLPIPGLDGGHILYFLIEFILRRPLSAAVEIFTMRLGLLFLLLLTLAVSFNDIMRLLK